MWKLGGIEKGKMGRKRRCFTYITKMFRSEYAKEKQFLNENGLFLMPREDSNKLY
jgi:hypothetical protein